MDGSTVTIEFARNDVSVPGTFTLSLWTAEDDGDGGVKLLNPVEDETESFRFDMVSRTTIFNGPPVKLGLLLEFAPDDIRTDDANGIEATAVLRPQGPATDVTITFEGTPAAADGVYLITLWNVNGDDGRLDPDSWIRLRGETRRDLQTIVPPRLSVAPADIELTFEFFPDISVLENGVTATGAITPTGSTCSVEVTFGGDPESEAGIFTLRLVDGTTPIGAPLTFRADRMLPLSHRFDAAGAIPENLGLTLVFTPDLQISSLLENGITAVGLVVADTGVTTVNVSLGDNPIATNEDGAFTLTLLANGAPVSGGTEVFRADAIPNSRIFQVAGVGATLTLSLTFVPDDTITSEKVMGVQSTAVVAPRPGAIDLTVSFSGTAAASGRFILSFLSGECETDCTAPETEACDCLKLVAGSRTIAFRSAAVPQSPSRISLSDIPSGHKVGLLLKFEADTMIKTEFNGITADGVVAPAGDHIMVTVTLSGRVEANPINPGTNTGVYRIRLVDDRGDEVLVDVDRRIAFSELDTATGEFTFRINATDFDLELYNLIRIDLDLLTGFAFAHRINYFAEEIEFGDAANFGRTIHYTLVRNPDRFNPARARWFPTLSGRLDVTRQIPRKADAEFFIAIRNIASGDQLCVDCGMPLPVHVGPLPLPRTLVSDRGECFERYENGDVVYERDAGGNLVYERDEKGDYVYRLDVNAQIIPLRDDDGNVVYQRDDNGELIYELDDDGEYKLDANGDRIPIPTPIRIPIPKRLECTRYIVLTGRPLAAPTLKPLAKAKPIYNVTTGVFMHEEDAIIELRMGNDRRFNRGQLMETLSRGDVFRRDFNSFPNGSPATMRFAAIEENDPRFAVRTPNPIPGEPDIVTYSAGPRFSSMPVRFRVPAQPKAPNVLRMAITPGRNALPSFIKGTSDKMVVKLGYVPKRADAPAGSPAGTLGNIIMDKYANPPYSEPVWLPIFSNDESLNPGDPVPDNRRTLDKAMTVAKFDALFDTWHTLLGGEAYNVDNPNHRFRLDPTSDYDDVSSSNANVFISGKETVGDSFKFELRMAAVEGKRAISAPGFLFLNRGEYNSLLSTTATVENVAITGTVGDNDRRADLVRGVRVTITVNGATPTVTRGTNVTPWFTNLPAGLEAEVTGIKGAIITVTIRGTATAATEGADPVPLEIRIAPLGDTPVAVLSPAGSVTVDPNPLATINITATEEPPTGDPPADS
jgi:hypothetical protein